MLFQWFKDYWLDPEFSRKKRFLQQVSFFQNVPRHEFGRLFQALALRTYQPGEILFKEGDVGRALFILEWGQVELTRRSASGHNQSLAVLEPGDYFGEMSLLDDMPRTASATAVTMSRVYLLYKTELDTLLRRAPRAGGAVMAHLAELLAARLRANMDQNRKAPLPASKPLIKEIV